MGAAGGGVVKQVAQQFGIDDNQAQSAISALLPALTNGMRNNNSGGVEGLLGALMNGNHQQYVDDPSSLASEETTLDGNSILGHVLGSKDNSRAVAAQAAQETGLDSSLLKQMLPVIATLAMGALSKHLAGGGAAAQEQPQGGGNLMGILGGLLGGGQQGGGNDMMGSVLRMAAGSLFGGNR